MDNNMILGISIYDNEDIDTESEELKWWLPMLQKSPYYKIGVKLQKLKNMKKLTMGKKTYRVNVGLNFVYE